MLLDADECLEGIFNCTGNEECENLPGGFRCLCPARLNMIRVNGTCTCTYVFNISTVIAYLFLELTRES